MALCSECPSKEHGCKIICEAVEKEITGRGKTASRKPRTYPIDFRYIEDTSQVLNPFQKVVLNTIRNFSLDTGEQLVTRLTVQETINKTLNDKERRVIQLFSENYKQEEIAKNLSISQPRVNFLLKRAIGKMKNFLEW
ncbi:MAG: Sigma-70, region 4 [Euryarchaeota archaeon]|nr:Sigma-70, region 4 [Euryarchaeota archaeon]